MEQRKFGRTGLNLSLLGFGCGAVGGLMIKGDMADQERAVWRALELGINYFDTAQMYGNGESERNLGRVWKSLHPEAYVGTKVRLPATPPGQIGAAIAASLDASLQRLQMEKVDLFQFHNAIVGTTDGADFSADICAGRGGAGVRAAARRRASAGFSASPRTARPPRCTGSVDARAFDSAPGQLQFARPRAPGRHHCRPVIRRRITTICSATCRFRRHGRHQHPRIGGRRPLRAATSAIPSARSLSPAPIGSGGDYHTDVGRARRFPAIDPARAMPAV